MTSEVKKVKARLLLRRAEVDYNAVCAGYEYITRVVEFEVPETRGWGGLSCGWEVTGAEYLEEATDDDTTE